MSEEGVLSEIGVHPVEDLNDVLGNLITLERGLQREIHVIKVQISILIRDTT